MTHRRIGGVWMIGIGAVLAAASVASAQWSDLQQNIFQNLNYALNPNYISQPQGGPLFNFNNFTQRVEYDRVGQGYAYDFYRFFGPDSFGEPNTISLGGFNLALGPDGSLGQSQYTGIHSRTGFTTRGIPEATFQTETGERVFNQFSGIGSFNKEPLHYDATLDTGLQKFEWTGNMQIDANGKINALGFYDFNMHLINVGNYTADGVLVKDEQVTDFDTGPIALSGNIGLDAISSLFQGNGTDAAAATPRIFSASAQKDRTADELMTAMKSGEKLSDEEVQFLIQQMFVKAFTDDPLGFIMNGPPATIPGFEGFNVSLSSEPAAGTTDPKDSEPTPEPGTLLLIGITAGIAIFIRKRGSFAGLRASLAF